MPSTSNGRVNLRVLRISRTDKLPIIGETFMTAISNAQVGSDGLELQGSIRHVRHLSVTRTSRFSQLAQSTKGCALSIYPYLSTAKAAPASIDDCDTALSPTPSHQWTEA